MVHETARFGRRTALGLLGAGIPLLNARGQSAPPAAPISPAMLEAAKKEGTTVWHTSIEVGVCQKMIAGFNTHHPDIKVNLERTGAERILQRINQEYASNIFNADVVESSDMGTFVGWKQRGWLAAYVTPDIAKYWPKEERDPEGRFASVRASLSVLAYNTKQVKAEDAPKGFADLLLPKWRMRMVKAHPAYSGSILTSTYATAKVMGWDYFEKLAKQRVMQTQSATEPPKKVAIGERSIAVDGSEYVLLNLQEAGDPVMPIYAIEGTPVFAGQCCVMEKAAHPNAARVFYDYLFSRECQQLMSDAGNLRSFNPEVKEKPGRKPLHEFKLISSTPEELSENGEETKKKYLAAFGV